MKTYYSKAELELELLEEVQNSGFDFDLWEMELKKVVDFSSIYLMKVIRIENKSVICEGIDYFYLIDNNNYSVGDLILTSQVIEKKIKVNPEILNQEFLKDKKINFSWLNEEQELNKEFLEQEMVRIKQQEEQEEKEREEQDKKEEEERLQDKIKEEQELKEWKDKSMYSCKDFYIDKNELFFDERKIVCEKNISEFFSYGEVGSWNYKYWDKIKPFNYKEINYSLFRKLNGNWVKKYSIDYSNEIKINDVKVAESKVKFILRNINENTTAEQIKILTQLTQQKADIINFEMITFNGDIDLDFPIKISLIDKDNFKVEFLGKEKVSEWSELKDIFAGNSKSVSQNIDSGKLMSLCELVGVSKTELFDKVKKLRILKELESG